MGIRRGRGTSVVARRHEREFAVHPGALVTELQRPRGKREVSGNGNSQCLGVRDDGFEVLHTDDDVHVLLHVKIFEVLRVYADGCFEGLLEDLCPQWSTMQACSDRGQRTFSILDLLSEACKDGLPFLGK